MRTSIYLGTRLTLHGPKDPQMVGVVDAIYWDSIIGNEYTLRIECDHDCYIRIWDQAVQHYIEKGLIRIDPPKPLY